MRQEASEREEGAFLGAGHDEGRTLEGDYRRAVALLKERMDGAHPAAVHRKMSVPGRSTYAYGERRLAVADAASTAIAMALHEGATVEEAAEAGAASAGL
jgi:hypothetical protein